MNHEENISLSEHTTFKIGGNARFFFRAKSVEDLKKALAFAKEEKVPFFILGGGSNLLVSDDGFSGVVIKNEILGTTFEESGGSVLVKVGAGENWDEFVGETVEKGFFGLENLSGIPGTVGAAPVQNIGAYGTEVKDTIVSVEVLDFATGEVETISNAECAFQYRDSFFKTSEGKNFIITSVTFRLKKEAPLNLEYKDLKNYFAGKPTPTLSEVRRAVLEIRSKKFPDLKVFGTAGSFFKNPIISAEKFQELKNKFPELPGFEQPGGLVKISLAWILDHVCQMKGFSKGALALFERQPIVLINSGGAGAQHVDEFAQQVIDSVKEKTGIEVEWEVQYIE